MLRYDQIIGKINNEGKFTCGGGFGVYDNIRIVTINNQYRVDIWEDGGVGWQFLNYFDTEHEAIMYGLTLV